MSIDEKIRNNTIARLVDQLVRARRGIARHERGAAQALKAVNLQRVLDHQREVNYMQGWDDAVSDLASHLGMRDEVEKLVAEKRETDIYNGEEW